MPKILPFFTLTPSASLPSSSANLAVQCTGQLIENAGAASCKTIHWIPPFLGQELPQTLLPHVPRDSRVRRIEEVQTRKKLGGNFLFPAPPPFSPAFLFRIFHTFALSPLSESLEKARAELAKGWKGKMYFRVGPRRLLEERLWKIHGHNIFFWEYRSPYISLRGRRWKGKGKGEFGRLARAQIPLPLSTPATQATHIWKI